MKGRIHALAITTCILLCTHTNIIAAGPQEDVETSASGKILPKIISQPAPVFPPSLAHSGVDGTVIVAFTVDEEGRVKDPEVATSPDRLLNPYAIKAVSAWRFIPGARNGRVTSFRLKAPVEFSAKAEDASHAMAGATVASSTPVAVNSVTPEIPPAPKRKPMPVYPYDLLVNGHSGWADASFIVDYTGRPLFANPAGSSDRAFAMAVVAMIEASAYSPGRKGKAPVMSPTKEHYEFAGEASLDPEAKRVLSEIRTHKSAILNTTDLDERPKVVQQVSAAYPRALKDDGLTGQAEIEFIIDRDGRVLFPRIVSATHEDFGWAAATAVAQWRFQPPKKGGQFVEARMSVPILFTAQKLAESD